VLAVLNVTLVRPLPFADADRLVQVFTLGRKLDLERPLL
jgi:hypothetical protein